jgi:signal transduction histidine kinase/CheY-like chemotaxis protein
MTTRILALELRREQDVVLARQRARQIARLVGLDGQDQVRLATAVSEIARNAFRYAAHGRVEFRLDPGAPSLVVTVTDQGPGIRDLPEVLSGRYRSTTGLGIGLVGTRRLVDDLQVRSAPGAGTEVTLTKSLSRARHGADPHALGEGLARETPADAADELSLLNQDLLRTLDEVRARHDDLARLNRELEDTNRGVVALYAELDEKAESLRRADQMKSRFLSHMSHEFRTPLNSILALTRLLQERADGELTPEQEKQVGYIRRAAHDLTELVNDLLDLAKVEAGKTEVRPGPFELGPLFGALRGLMRPLQVSSAVGLVFEDPSGIPALHSDEGKVGQILRNLVSNALKFTEKGEVRVSARATADGSGVSVEVADTGLGIAPDDQERIFQEFGQVDSPVQRRVRGTGLGLALSRKLAELLGGTLTVRSAPGQGSTFTLALPRIYAGAASDAPAEPAPAVRAAASTAPPADVAPPSAARARALVIDDEEDARYALGSRLAALPFEVLEAADPRDGLRLAREARPAAIFLDLVMPEMLGFEVLERLRDDPATRNVPVVVVTSKTLTPEEDSRLAARGAAVLTKEEYARADGVARIRHALLRAGFSAPMREGEEQTTP